jgi:hypothetical protein
MNSEQAAALRKPFDPKTVGKLPKGGVMLDFVGHAAVTDRLLAVDPDWSWEPFAIDENGLPAYQNGCLWIRLTICGVTRVGVGDGPDAKQRIGDAIRNAAMRFGVALDLWSRQELEGVDPNGGDAAARSGKALVDTPLPARPADRQAKADLWTYAQAHGYATVPDLAQAFGDWTSGGTLAEAPVADITAFHEHLKATVAA